MTSELTGILETVLYYEAGQEDALAKFYGEMLRLKRIGDLNFRVGNGVLLFFPAAESSVQDSPPPHGATGRLHTCFLAPAGEYDAWRERVVASGVEIIEDITWDRTGLRSFYFHDPAGHVIEIAEGDLWP